MKIYAALTLLVLCAVVLPGGGLLLPLAYAKYRRFVRGRRVTGGDVQSRMRRV